MMFRLTTVPAPPRIHRAPPRPISAWARLSWMRFPTICGEDPESREKIPPPAPWVSPAPPLLGGVLMFLAISLPAMIGCP